MQLHAAVLGSGWYGPELLPLAAAVRRLQQQQQQEPSATLLEFIAAALLPAVGRADELSHNQCVTSGSYKDALRELTKDDVLLPLLSKEAMRSLALTYWYQVRGVLLLPLSVGTWTFLLSNTPSRSFS